MIKDHDGGALPSVSPKTSTIVTICIHGSDRKPPPKTRKRAHLLQTIVSTLLAQAGPEAIEAIQLPGGFFRTPKPIGLEPSLTRRSILAGGRVGEACAAASVRLAERWPGIALVVGIDSDPLSKKLGGDQLSVAWRDGEIVALGRKAFPVDQDTNGEGPVYWVVPADATDPGRILKLSNGARAILLSCYDAFAVRALAGARYAKLGAIQLAADADNKLTQPPLSDRRAMLVAWQNFLRRENPDLGLIAIHRFRRPGQDGYWQRHGIAGASAAMFGRSFLGAAHVRTDLPHPNSMTLAAADVPDSHLGLGAFRPAHRLQPSHGFLLDAHAGRALIRFFTLQH